MKPPPDRRGPRPLGDALGALFAQKGLARLHAASELEAAWREAAGENVASRTKVGGVRHGVLSISVSHPALLEELSAFRKAELLATLRERVPHLSLHDIRFRVGPVDTGLEPDQPPPSSPSKPTPKRPRRGG